MWISVTWDDKHDTLGGVRNSHTYRREAPRPDFRIVQTAVVIPETAALIADSTPTPTSEHFKVVWVAQVWISRPTPEERRHHREVQKSYEAQTRAEARAETECQDARVALDEDRRRRGRRRSSTGTAGYDVSNPEGTYWVYTGQYYNGTSSST